MKRISILIDYTSYKRKHVNTKMQFKYVNFGAEFGRTVE